MERLSQFFERVELKEVTEENSRAPEARAARRRVWLRAMAGELVCTFLFFFSVMGANINFAHIDDKIAGDQSKSLSRMPLATANALVSGFTAIGVVYSFADVSGAHFNPAVTFATWLARKTSNRKSFSYVVMQMAASVLATLLLMAVFPVPQDVNNVAEFLAIEPPGDVSLFRVFLMEFILTFTFITVIFMTVFEHIEARGRGPKRFKGIANARGLTLYTTNPQSKTGFAPLAIGFAIGFLSFVGGTVSGGVFNPARLFGPALLSWHWRSQWVYWLGELGGAACAALLSGLFVRLGKGDGGEEVEESAPLDTPLLPHVSSDEDQHQREISVP